MRPGARPPLLDAVQSSLRMCLLVFLPCVEAAVSESGVYNGESDGFSELWLELQIKMSYSSCVAIALCWNVVSNPL